MKKIILSGVAAAVMSMTVALPVSAQNIAVVNGKPITKDRMDALLQQVKDAGQQVTPEMESQAKEELILREILVQQAKKEGVESSKTYKSQLELARQGIMINEYLKAYQKKHPITDAAVQAEYDKFVAANKGKEYQVSHILVEKESDANDILAKLKKDSGKFAELAKANSKDPGSAAKGGDLDWAPASAYVKEFADTVTSLKKGEMAQAPVKTQFGWHIVRVLDERDAVLPKLEEVKPQVVQQLQRDQLMTLRKDLREKAKVE